MKNNKPFWKQNGLSFRYYLSFGNYVMGNPSIEFIVDEKMNDLKKIDKKIFEEMIYRHLIDLEIKYMKENNLFTIQKQKKEWGKKYGKQIN